MQVNIRKLAITGILLITLALPTGFGAQAQTSVINVSEKEKLEKELADIEIQIKAFEDELANTQGEKKTLEQAIKRLRGQEDSLRLQIKSTNLKLKDLDKKLDYTEQNITKTKAQSAKLKKQLVEVIRLINQKDQELLIESLSAKDGLSEVAQNIQNYTKIFSLLQAIVAKTRSVHEDLQKQQTALEDQQDDARKLLEIKASQQELLLSTLAEKKELLTETKGKENTFQDMLADAKKRANQIRNRIYETIGGGTQVTFEKAVEIADWAGKQTGIRTPFLLAVLTQESNLGKNVGTCNRLGDPSEKSWQVIMKPTRDHEPFKTITSELGLDIDITPVSCPMRQGGKQIGWGGAMGPAQFIPSTWMGYRSRVSAITGRPANPWDIKDAMLAAAIKLRADGANGTYDSEWKAAMKYFAGSVNLAYRFYGDNVMKITAKYEIDVEAIKTASF
ncbi:MAG: hypothetical protein A3I29_02495 [Candidatus Magasanikbacteria bacterium RIFCSPLOWO2_02_FULL_44_11]|uniref:Transglycosylase SLT domain-containing protein n=1 Tax=Candidatus Magasanikbacteria bacterium RIFCSPLOWO2_02_FULL_44_11 TaxID=1798689 RepID=A0A1F6NBF6_9BACT|nr:MAG: hypothetical protein A3I29_02495 [Candidatus Magasanikbacteria bacterium RIFCSPLOWO2_02_FULL_44_11]